MQKMNTDQKMTDDDKWYYVSGVLINLKKQRDRLHTATDQLLINPESSLIEPFFLVSDDLISSLSLLIDDNSENISWFVYENNFGEGGIEAGCKDDMRLIDSVERLRWLVELDCEETEAAI